LPAAAEVSATAIVVVGAGGTPEYEEQFHTWADRWRTAAEAGGVAYYEIGRGPEGDVSDRQQLEELLRTQWQPGEAPLWLVLIGHGTFNRDAAKFNLRGADFAATELAAWLPPLERPLIVINCASASGPFINSLSGAGRAIITATKSGAEQNYARFGDYMSTAIVDPAADLDHDHQVSLLEAYLSASAGVARFYAEDSRLATEHPLLDDNGDSLGAPATFFQGVRAVQAAKEGAEIDGRFAHRFQFGQSSQADALSAEQLARRDQLEQEIEQLRLAKSTMTEDDYYQALEALLVQLARLYAEPNAAPSAGDDET
jgi:hypothetical protein